MGFFSKSSGKKKEVHTNKIGSVEIIWVANKEAVSKFASLGAASGLGLREIVSTLMGRDGSRSDLVVSANRISLSPARQAWCQTTPIYRSKKVGSIYVLFEKVDDDTCKENELELLGTIDAQAYAVALCATHGLDGKKVFA